MKATFKIKAEGRGLLQRRLRHAKQGHNAEI